MKPNFMIVLGVLFVLSGCSSTGIMKIGEDRYKVSKNSMKVGFGAPTGAYEKISKEAEDFCAKQNKTVDVVDTDIIHPAVGRPGSATIEFRCMDESK